MSSYLLQNIVIMDLLVNKVEDLGKQVLHAINVNVEITKEILWDKSVKSFSLETLDGKLIAIRKERQGAKARIVFDFQKPGSQVTHSKFSALTVNDQVKIAKLLNSLYNR